MAVLSRRVSTLAAGQAPITATALAIDPSHHVRCGRRQLRHLGTTEPALHAGNRPIRRAPERRMDGVALRAGTGCQQKALAVDMPKRGGLAARPVRDATSVGSNLRFVGDDLLDHRLELGHAASRPGPRRSAAAPTPCRSPPRGRRSPACTGSSRAAPGESWRSSDRSTRRASTRMLRVLQLSAATVRAYSWCRSAMGMIMACTGASQTGNAPA